MSWLRSRLLEGGAGLWTELSAQAGGKLEIKAQSCWRKSRLPQEASGGKEALSSRDAKHLTRLTGCWLGRSKGTFSSREL